MPAPARCISRAITRRSVVSRESNGSGFTGRGQLGDRERKTAPIGRRGLSYSPIDDRGIFRQRDERQHAETPLGLARRPLNTTKF